MRALVDYLRGGGQRSRVPGYHPARRRGRARMDGPHRPVAGGAGEGNL